MPLGFDPVMGEPRDLSDPEYRDPTPEEIAEAEADFQSMLGGPAQRFKAALEKTLLAPTNVRNRKRTR